MFLSKVKAKGKVYYYAYVYDGNAERGTRSVYSLGRTEKAIDQISAWKKAQKNIPGELIELGLQVENLDKWIEKIKAV